MHTHTRTRTHTGYQSFHWCFHIHSHNKSECVSDHRFFWTETRRNVTKAQANESRPRHTDSDRRWVYHPYRCCSFMVLHSLAPPRLSEISWGSLWMFADAKDYCKEHQPPNTPVEPWVWRDDLLDLRRGAVSFCSRCPAGIFEVPSPLRYH